MLFCDHISCKKNLMINPNWSNYVQCKNCYQKSCANHPLNSMYVHQSDMKQFECIYCRTEAQTL